MSPRLRLPAAATPLLMAGALWATSALAPVALGGGAQTPPPCGPDGVCVPRPQTFGWYQTRWRTFPGDVAAIPPTPATGGDQPDREELGGPELPDASEEGQLGPASSRPAEAAPGGEAPAEGEPAAEDAAEAGLGELPGEAPLRQFEVPGIGGAPAPGAGETPPPTGQSPTGEGAIPEAGSGGEPGSDPLDPFGATPPAPPAWISNAALRRAALDQSSLEPLPMVEHAAAIAEALEGPPVLPPMAAPTAQPPLKSAPPASAGTTITPPSDQDEDAPPMLPPGLARGAGTSAPIVAQPASVQPMIDGNVTAASAVQPADFQLVNPAAESVDVEPLQQAIYFEASDK
jgi:hypothetical protein